MGSRDLDLAELEDRLRDSASEAGVHGAAVAIVVDGDVTATSTGVTSLGEPVPVTAATKFRIGSIAKLYTSTLLAELLVEGDVGFDHPVTGLIPGFRLADGAEGDVDVVHLLTHTGGFEGDLWEEDFGEGGDAVARYVDACRSLATIFPPGSSFGYSNTGFVIAGRIVEVLTGLPFAGAAQRFLSRLRLDETQLVPGMPPPGAANGHYVEAGGVREAGLPEEGAAFAPAGASWFATARDVLEFARMHRPGQQRLDPHVVDAMQIPRLELPPAGGAEPTHHGLGWKIYDWPSGVLVGHNGNGTGQVGFVRYDPTRDVGVVLLTNTIRSGLALWSDLASYLAPRLAIQPPPPLRPNVEGTGGNDVHLGTYAIRGFTLRVSPSPKGLSMEMQVLSEAPTTVDLLPVDDDRYVTTSGAAVIFGALPDGVRLLHYGPLTARRVPDDDD